MQSRLRGEAKQAAEQLRESIKAYEADRSNQDKFYVVYYGVQRVIKETKELQEDVKLE